MNKLGGIMWRIRRISLGVCLFVCVCMCVTTSQQWIRIRISSGVENRKNHRGKYPTILQKEKEKKNMENIDIKMPQICINIPQNVNIWRRSITICKSPTNITVALVWTMLDRLQIIDYSYISNECSTFLSIIIVHCDSIDFLHSAANHFNHFSTSVNNHSTLF